MGGDDRFITQHEAARLAGVSYDSIRRARKAGQLPSARQRHSDSAWLISTHDLVDAGLVGASEAAASVAGVAPSGRLIVDLAAGQAQIAELRAALARRDDDVERLERLLGLLLRPGGEQ
jgi:hypothetical protein